MAQLTSKQTVTSHWNCTDQNKNKKYIYKEKSNAALQKVKKLKYLSDDSLKVYWWSLQNYNPFLSFPVPSAINESKGNTEKTHIEDKTKFLTSSQNNNKINTENSH